MGKFKKGDWLLEDDAEPGRDMLHHGYYVHDVLPNGSYVVQLDPGGFELRSEVYLAKCTVEPRCTGWGWVLPEPANRFGLKVGDTITIKPHDARDGYVSTSHVIVAIDDSFGDGIARFRLDDMRPYPWHPYHFGLCQSDGSPLPPKPATKKVLLEEWVFLSGFERSKPCSEAVFNWRPAGGHSHGTWTGWTNTGVTRELEVPDVR